MLVVIMASKKFKGKTCAYCAERASTTADHVFARAFFPMDQRSDLPQAPACQECNEKKSRIEHYLTALLPFGGRQVNSGQFLEEAAPPKLGKNARLHRELEAEQGRVWTTEPSGLVVPTMALPLDGEEIERYFGFVVKGLLWHHWQEVLLPDTLVQVMTLTKHGETVFEPYMSMQTDRQVDVVLGSEIFAYRGLQGVDNRQISVWTFQAYGGLKVSDESGEECSRWGVMTVPAKISERADRAVRALAFVLPPNFGPRGA